MFRLTFYFYYVKSNNGIVPRRERHIKITLQGWIDDPATKRVIDQIRIGIESDGIKMVEIEIDSEGGETVPALELISNINELRQSGLRVIIVVKDAKSCAALIALSTADVLKMHGCGTISIHRGTINSLEATDFNPYTGLINQDVLKIFTEYSKKLLMILEIWGLTKRKKLMSTLYATNWLVLDAETCLQLGIVSEIV